MTNGNDKETALKGLDEYAKRFLIPSEDGPSDIKIDVGDMEGAKKRLAIYVERQKEDFIQRAGNFTQDLVGFIVEQQRMRELDDRTVVFSLALANINLRHSYCDAQNKEEEVKFDSRKKKELGKEWDSICWAAQSYFNENV